MPNELKDIKIESMGLVSVPAVSVKDQDGEEENFNFLILKNREGKAMSDEVTNKNEEGTETPTFPEQPPQSWLDSITSAIAGAFSRDEQEAEKADPEMVGQAAAILQEGGYDIDPEMLMEVLAEYDTSEGEEPTPEQETEGMEMSKSGVKIQDIVKAEVAALRTTYEGALAESSELVKSLNDELAEAKTQIDELSKAHTDRKAELLREQVQKQAHSYKTLPVPIEDMTDLLLKTKGAVDEETYTQLSELLKTTDRQMFLAGMFGETGSARTPEQQEIEDKVAKADDPKQALLDLPAEEQAELLKQWEQE